LLIVGDLRDKLQDGTQIDSEAIATITQAVIKEDAVYDMHYYRRPPCDDHPDKKKVRLIARYVKEICALLEPSPC